MEGRRTEIVRPRRILSRNQCALPTPYFCLVCGCVLICLQRKKPRKIASSPSDGNDSGDQSTTHQHSPPRFTTQQKEKGRAAHNPLPTPVETQQRPNHGQPHQPQQSSSQYRDRPGPNLSAQRPQYQLERTPRVSDQHHARGQKDGHSRQKRTTEKKWTRVAKFYGIYNCPWVLEPQLVRVLHYEEGRDLPDGDPDQELLTFLEELEVSDRDRKDPRFQANASIIPKIFTLTVVLMGCIVFTWASRVSW